jgi:ParB family transcriptional regulator, chromosome partitioning protein
MSGLGRGLGSLIPNKKIVDDAINDEHKDLLVDDSNKILQVSIEKIDLNPMQPRKTFNHADLEDLISSIKKFGILQPLVVTRQGNKFELIAGERRLRASKVLELKTVPCIVRQADEQEKLELALIENIQRENLNPIEEALAYQKLIDQFNLNQEDASEKVGKSRSTVANIIRLLDLPEEIQKALIDKKITQGHARVILGFDTQEQQLDFLNKIVQYNFTVRDAEKESQGANSRKPIKKIVLDPQTEAVKEDLRDVLATKVDIKKKQGKGQILINFYSEEEFNDIVNKITK